jgi:hypothetical protein
MFDSSFLSTLGILGIGAAVVCGVFGLLPLVFCFILVGVGALLFVLGEFRG